MPFLNVFLELIKLRVTQLLVLSSAPKKRIKIKTKHNSHDKNTHIHTYTSHPAQLFYMKSAQNASNPLFNREKKKQSFV
jgi:hypothetical protein